MGIVRNQRHTAWPSYGLVDLRFPNVHVRRPDKIDAHDQGSAGAKQCCRSSHHCSLLPGAAAAGALPGRWR